MKQFRSRYAHYRYFRSGYFRLFFVLIIVLPLLIFTMSACSTGPETKASALPIKENKAKTMESKYVANEIGAQEVAEIKFQRGSHSIPRNELIKIQKAVSDARKIGPVEEIRIVSWADNEYPSTYTKKLPEDQQELAELRANEIKTMLGADDAIEVKTYNMAKRPGAVQTLLSTSDYQMKSALEKAGVPNTHTGVKLPSFAGKALVMVLADVPEAENTEEEAK
jgi:hypothetical protein